MARSTPRPGKSTCLKIARAGRCCHCRHPASCRRTLVEARPLADYIAGKYKPGTGKRDPDQIPIADVLIFLTDVAPERAREEEIKQHLEALWEERKLADVTGRSCRDYVAHRTSQTWKSCKPEKTGRPPRMVSEAAARRELEDLRAAINYHRGEGLCSELVTGGSPTGRCRAKAG
jgi:hypothetical protein